MKRIQQIILTTDDNEIDPTKDHIHIMNILLLSYILRAFQLIIYLLSGSYFMGLLWYVYCD